MKYISFVLVFIFSSLQLTAQHENCGGVHENVDHFSGLLDNQSYCNGVDCETQVQEWMDSCEEVWVNVTVHYLIIGDCDGTPSIGSAGVPYNDAGQNSYDRAEEMINDANEMLQNYEDNDQFGQDIWGHPDHNTAPTCMPLRWKLNGVEFHCMPSDPGNGCNALNSLANLDPSSLHVLMKPINADWNGVACSNGTVMELFTADLLNHELLHVLGLDHTFENANNCPDVPAFPSWTWNNPNAPSDDTSGDQCYSIYPEDHPYCQGPVPHPCCNDCMENNNTMAYSSINDDPEVAAITPCQVEAALTDLCNDHCHQIDDTFPPNVCNPPNAFIDIPEFGIFDVNGCDFCFQMSPSFNDKNHRITFYENNGFFSSFVTSTGWVPGEAGEYCLPYNKKNNTWGKDFKPEKTYTIILQVKNKCGDVSTARLDFKMPKGCIEDEEEIDCYPPIVKEVKYSKKEVFLSWNDSKNNKSYTIQYESLDGRYRNAITTNNTNSISFPHYDRVYTIDVRSNCEGTKPTTEEETHIGVKGRRNSSLFNAQKGFVIYPNPVFGNQLNINITEPSSLDFNHPIEVTITDLLGLKVYTELIIFSGKNTTIKLDDNFNGGAYTISLRDIHKTYYVNKAIILSNK